MPYCVTGCQCTITPTPGCPSRESACGDTGSRTLRQRSAPSISINPTTVRSLPTRRRPPGTLRVDRSGQLRGLDVRLGCAKTQCPHERHVVAARRDVVIVYCEAHVVDAALLQRLVVGVGQTERTHDDHRPDAVLPRR